MDRKNLRQPADFDPFGLLGDGVERPGEKVLPYDPVREEEMARGIFRPV
jgi:hypothetical protein